MMISNKYNIIRLRFIRRIVFIMILISIIPIAIEKNIVNYLLSIIILIISYLISRFYRCPLCHKVFDIRMRINKDSYCSRCGNKI